MIPRSEEQHSWDVGTGSGDVNLMQFTYFYLFRVNINSPAVASRDEFTSEIRYPRRKSDGLVSRNLLLPNTQPRRRGLCSQLDGLKSKHGFHLWMLNWISCTIFYRSWWYTQPFVRAHFAACVINMLQLREIYCLVTIIQVIFFLSNVILF